VSAGVATVGLSSTFAEATGATQLDLIVELVCTLTAQPGIGQVRFELRGERIEIPRGDGSLTAEAVSRDDYRGLIH
ncbi:MAG: GerMN domain-containing protein, partial [Actinomycetota bacterium]|nr:GerMN domain-containing protein [Actinomycetota bacterium]